MILYTDSAGIDSIFGEEATPAHFYLGIQDFSTILDDMAAGKIPTNTQQVFPVIWKSDQTKQNGSSNNRLWDENSNPWLSK